MTLYHLLEPDAWAAAGASYEPASLAAEGFVHLSFAEQVEGSANRHLAEAPALLALEVDESSLTDEVRVEDSYGSGSAYPHLYGPLPRCAVVAQHPVHRDQHGRWRFAAPSSR